MIQHSLQHSIWPLYTRTMNISFVYVVLPSVNLKNSNKYHDAHLTRALFFGVDSFGNLLRHFNFARTFSLLKKQEWQQSLYSTWSWVRQKVYSFLFDHLETGFARSSVQSFRFQSFHDHQATHGLKHENKNPLNPYGWHTNRFNVKVMNLYSTCLQSLYIHEQLLLVTNQGQNADQ